MKGEAAWGGAVVWGEESMRGLWVVGGYWSRDIYFTGREGALKEDWEWYEYVVKFDDGSSGFVEENKACFSGRADFKPNI